MTESASPGASASSRDRDSCAKRALARVRSGVVSTRETLHRHVRRPWPQGKAGRDLAQRGGQGAAASHGGGPELERCAWDEGGGRREA